jgi:hypothetical protein
VTNAGARRVFAGRVTEQFALYEGEKLKQRRVRRRQPLGPHGFRAWAREQFRKTPREQLSPRLALIVHGQQ